MKTVHQKVLGGANALNGVSRSEGCPERSKAQRDIQREIITFSLWRCEYHGILLNHL